MEVRKMAGESKGLFPETRLSVMSKLASNQSLAVDELDWVNQYLSVIQTLGFMRMRQETAGDAEDVASAVMMKVIGRFQQGKFDPSCGSLHSYIVESLRKEIYSRHRSEVAAKRIPSEKLDSRDRFESSDKVCEGEEALSEECGREAVSRLSEDFEQKSVRFFREECLRQCGAWSVETKEIIRYYIFDGHTLEESAAHFGTTKAHISDVKRRFSDFFELEWAPQQQRKYENHPSLFVRELYCHCKDSGVFLIR